MMKRKTIMSQEMLEKLVKKKQISLNSYFGCPLSFHKAKNDNKTMKTLSFSILSLLKYKTVEENRIEKSLAPFNARD